MTEPRQRTPPGAMELIALELPLEPALHPRGDRAAFSLTKVDWGRGEERCQLHELRIDAAEDGRKPRQLTYGLSDAIAPSYSPDGRWLAFITFRPQPEEDEEQDAREDGSEKRQVFVMDVGGGESRRLTESPEGVEAFRWAADSSGVYVLGAAPRPSAESAWRRQRSDQHDDPHVADDSIPEWEIWFHPLEQGERRRLLSREKGVGGFDVSADGKWLAYSTTHTGRREDEDRAEVLLVDLEQGKTRRVSDGRGGCESDPCFSRDGRELYVWGWADPAVSFSRQELFVHEIAEPGSRLRPLLEQVDRDLEEYLPLDDGRIAAVVADGMSSRLLLIDPRGGTTRSIETGAGAVHGLCLARDTGALAFVAESPGHPPELTLLDSATGKLRRLSDLNPSHRQWALARRERITWSVDGLEHEGLLLLPGTEAGSPPPLLVWIHGGPHWRVTDTLRVSDAELFAAHGWAVFLPQFRGSSGQGQDYALALAGDLGGGDARDVLAGLDKLEAMGRVDLSRAAVGGASYGGYLTNWLLATTGRFRAGISIAGIFDLAQDYATSSYSSWEEQYLGGPPWSRAEIYRERSPLFRADRIEAPVLILHGWEDDNTPFTNGKALYRALTALGRTTELVLYPREGHGLAEPKHRLDALHRMVEWLERHVMGRAAPHVGGRVIEHDAVRLLPLGHQLREDYSGVRPPEGRVYLEVSLQLTAREGGADFLRLVPSGPSADVVLVDQAGDVLRPIGVPLEVQGQPVLFSGRGAVEAWEGEHGQAPALPLSVVFEIPERRQRFELRVSDLEAVIVEVRPEPDADADESRSAN